MVVFTRGRAINCQKLVVVCGAGAAGLAAALSAARGGADVMLVERSARIGGTVVNSLIHTIGGLFDDAGEVLNGGLAEELCDGLIRASEATCRRRLGKTWVLNVSPYVYGALAESWLRAQAKILVLLETFPAYVRVKDRVIKEIGFSAPTGDFSIWPKAVVDTTGCGAVTRLIDPDLLSNDEPSAGGLIFRIRGVEPGALDKPKGIGILRALRAAAARGDLPSECEHAWLDTGVHADETYVKLIVKEAQGTAALDELRELHLQTRSVILAVEGFLRELPGFGAARVVDVGEIGVRCGGTISGEYRLSYDDLKAARRFPDAACRGYWPFEYWHPEKGVDLEYLPTRSYYEIPMRALKVRDLGNLWTAGKSLSADWRAQSSARVVGHCWSMGEAVGKAAIAL